MDEVKKQSDEKLQPNMVLRYAGAFIVCLILAPFAAALFVFLFLAVFHPDRALDFFKVFLPKVDAAFAVIHYHHHLLLDLLNRI